MPRFTSSVTTLSEQEVEQRLAPVFPGIDSGRAVVAQRALSLEQSRLRGAEREASRMAFKYGAGSARAMAAADALDDVQGRIIALELEVERTRVDVQPDPNGIIVQGRVLDPNFRGVRKLTVAMLDPAGKQLARTATDKTGSFRLAVVATSELKAPEAEAGNGGEKAPAGTRGKVKTAASSTARRPVLVVSQGKRELHREPLPPLDAGQTRYVEIVLSDRG